MDWDLLFCVSLTVPFVLGLSRLPLWTFFVLPACAVVVGIAGYVDEPAGYDMRGFGLSLGVGVGMAWLCTAAVARALSDAIRPRRPG